MDLEGARKKGIPRNPENTTHFLSNYIYITVISEPWVDSTSTVSKVDSSLLRTRMIPSSITKTLKIEETILQWKESLAPKTNSKQTRIDCQLLLVSIFLRQIDDTKSLNDSNIQTFVRHQGKHGQVYLWPHGTYINMHHAKATCQCPMFLFGPEPFTQIRVSAQRL